MVGVAPAGELVGWVLVPPSPWPSAAEPLPVAPPAEPVPAVPLSSPAEPLAGDAVVPDGPAGAVDASPAGVAPSAASVVSHPNYIVP